jgi:3-isopropylmalate dehydratase
MAAAAALTGKLTDVRKFLNLSTVGSTDGSIKLTNSLDYMKDSVLPPPPPQRSVAPSAASHESTASAAEGTLPKFTVLKGIAAPLDIENVNTDLIIPKQFLKTLKRTGLGDALFWTLRKDPYTGRDTDFILNKAPYNKAKIMVCVGENFGCGSSREHAPWSL